MTLPPRLRRSLFPSAVLLSVLTLAGCAVVPADGDAARFTDVLYVTDRAERTERSDGPRYGGRRGDLSQGVCTVRFRSLPTDGTRLPRWSRSLHRVLPLEAAAFERRLQTPSDSDRPIVVFVHGYAYGFQRACRRAAQMQRQLGHRAIVALFSWPSDGNPVDYVSDLADAEWAGRDLAEVVSKLAAAAGPERLRLVSHSLGARTVVEALTRLRLTQETPLAEHLVLLAPDLDSATFRAQWPLLAPMFRFATLYASESDAPLSAAASLHEQPRLGQAGEALTLLDDMQTIDVSPLSRYHPTGHEYHRRHPVVIEDLRTLLLEQPDAAQRPLPVPRRHASGRAYFELLRPDDAPDAQPGDPRSPVMPSSPSTRAKAHPGTATRIMQP